MRKQRDRRFAPAIAIGLALGWLACYSATFWAAQQLDRGVIITFAPFDIHS